MSFYSRKIPIYKSFRVVDSNGDGNVDSMVYAPLNDFYYLQIGIEQTSKDIGYYKSGIELEEPPFEVLCSSELWDLSNDGSNDNDTSNLGGISLSPLTGDTIGTNLQDTNVYEYCPDVTATNYNASLIGNPSYTPCTNLSCCSYVSDEDYSSGTSAGNSSEDLECLTVYTDWGPWNDNLLLNDTSQVYNIGNGTNANCVITLRFINQNNDNNGATGFGFQGAIEGGWNGSGIKIEVDSGSGFQVINQGNTMINSVEESLEFNSNDSRWTLGKKVRLFRVKDGSGGTFGTFPDNYYSTKPYRDLKLSPPNGSQIKITYYTPTFPTNPNPYTSSSTNDYRLQIFKGPTPEEPPVQTPDGSWRWEVGVQNPSFLPNFPLDRYNQGESFYYIDNTINSVSANNKIGDYWEAYLSNWQSTYLPWGPSNSQAMPSDFWNIPNLSLEYDFGDGVNSNYMLPPSGGGNLPNQGEVLATWNNTCQSGGQIVSYFDKDGDGFIEWDANYPNIDPNNSGSVDDGLFSKTRYDSPYIYLEPGTTDGSSISTPNELTDNTAPTQSTYVGPTSQAGWKQYSYKNPQNVFNFKNVSPTCQLGGVDNLFNTDPNLVDQSNSNIFLPQTDAGLGVSMTEAANIQFLDNNVLTNETINHVWNKAGFDAKGGCCAKQYTSNGGSTNGPFFSTHCSQCHSQLTTRSAQPVFDPQTIIDMQTTDSNVFYGPFFDPTNPTYNGYGLAFSKANNYCRNVRSKNGVDPYNSPQGTKESQTFIGGIMLGGGAQYSYGSTNYNMAQDTLGTVVIPNAWITPPSPCGISDKMPRKCTPVLGGPGNDENCLSAKCMKCTYCFKCKSQVIQPGVFVGNSSSVPSTSGTTTGAGGGVTQGSGNNAIDGSETTPAFFTIADTYTGYIEIFESNPNNNSNIEIKTYVQSGTVGINYTITDIATGLIYTTNIYTVTHTGPPSPPAPQTVNITPITLPIGSYNFEVIQNYVGTGSYGNTAICLGNCP